MEEFNETGVDYLYGNFIIEKDAKKLNVKNDLKRIGYGKFSRFLQQPTIAFLTKSNNIKASKSDLFYEALTNDSKKLITIKIKENITTNPAKYFESIILNCEEYDLVNIRKEEDNLELFKLNEKEIKEKLDEFENEFKEKFDNGKFEDHNLSDIKPIAKLIQPILDSRRLRNKHLKIGDLSESYISERVFYFYMKNPQTSYLDQFQIDYIKKIVSDKIQKNQKAFKKSELDKFCKNLNNLNENRPVPRSLTSWVISRIKSDMIKSITFDEELEQELEMIIYEHGSEKVDLAELKISLEINCGKEIQERVLDAKIIELRSKLGILELEYSDDQYKFINKLVAKYNKDHLSIDFAGECRKFNDLPGKKSAVKNFRVIVMNRIPDYKTFDHYQWNEKQNDFLIKNKDVDKFLKGEKRIKLIEDLQMLQDDDQDLIITNTILKNKLVHVREEKGVEVISKRYKYSNRQRILINKELSILSKNKQFRYKLLTEEMNLYRLKDQPILSEHDFFVKIKAVKKSIKNSKWDKTYGVNEVVAKRDLIEDYEDDVALKEAEEIRKVLYSSSAIESTPAEKPPKSKSTSTKSKSTTKTPKSADVRQSVSKSTSESDQSKEPKKSTTKEQKSNKSSTKETTKPKKLVEFDFLNTEPKN